MYILKNTPSAEGQYGPILTSNQPVPPEGYVWWPDGLDRTTFDQYQGFVELEVARGTVVSCQPNQPAFEAWQAEQLAARKVERIAESKAQLSDYLLCHPMQWTDGQYYAITAEKQQQLTSKIMSATLAAQTGTPYSLTWNATGEECQAWTLENLTALAFAIDARVTSLVSYQQEKEVEMRNAQSLAALEAIVVDYDTVGQTGQGDEGTE